MTTIPANQFAPFTVTGAPFPADMVAALYSSEHGDRLYIVNVP